MALTVRRAHRKGRIDEPKHETQPVVVPARQVVILGPHKSIRRPPTLRHDGQHQHRDRQPAHAHVECDRVDQRQMSVPEYHNRAAEPVHQLECNENLPCVPLDLRVRELVQRNQLVSESRRDGRRG